LAEQVIPGFFKQLPLKQPYPLAQALFVVQDVAQIPPEHVYPGWQVVVPRQDPLPLHSPLAEVAVGQAPTQVPSAVLAGTLEQLPTDPLKLHEEQTGQLALVQHTPSTQLPVEHPAAEVQLCPTPIFVQTPPMQLKLSAVSQFVLAFPTVHELAQAPETHIYPVGHATGVPGVQVPEPLHFPVPAPVLIASWLSAQPDAGVQALPFHCSQAPVAVHLPSVPQLVLAVTEQRL
jgi:hypothetical protein